MTLDELRKEAKNRHIEVWHSHGVEWNFKKLAPESGKIIALTEERALYVMMPDLDPLLNEATP